MELKDQFRKAAEDIKKLTGRPSNETLLELYALFKQGNEGDVTGSRPGLLDLKGRAKFDAWSKKRGTPQDLAMKLYIELVEKLLK